MSVKSFPNDSSRCLGYSGSIVGAIICHDINTDLLEGIGLMADAFDQLRYHRFLIASCNKNRILMQLSIAIGLTLFNKGNKNV